jgi:hypothetical protein
MAERPNLESGAQEYELRRLAEYKLCAGKTLAEMLGVVSSSGVFGYRDKYDRGDPKTRFDINGSSYVPDQGYQTLSIRTYRDNVPRWDVSRTGEVANHEETPTAIFWQDNTGKAAGEAGPIYQYGSEVPLGPSVVRFLANEIRLVEPLTEIAHTRHAFIVRPLDY